MGTIASTSQDDQTSCGFYAAYAVSLVYKAGGYSDGLEMSDAVVMAERDAFTGGHAFTMLPGQAVSFLATLGVSGYMSSPAHLTPGKRRNVRKHLSRGHAMMAGTLTHWWAILAPIGQKRMLVYDPAPRGGSQVYPAALGEIAHCTYLVHPRW